MNNLTVLKGLIQPPFSLVVTVVFVVFVLTRVLEWEVRGWRRSSARIRDVLDEIAAGRDSQPTVGTFILLPG